MWFLSTAPNEALLTIEDHPLTEDHLPQRLGTITLDVAVTHSLNKRRWDRMALYADKDGGDVLLEWYQRQGMSVLPADRRRPRSPRRLIKPSDGRYCYFTVDAALESSRSLDPLRRIDADLSGADDAALEKLRHHRQFGSIEDAVYAFLDCGVLVSGPISSPAKRGEARHE